jgi:hypothetical protein
VFRRAHPVTVLDKLGDGPPVDVDIETDADPPSTADIGRDEVSSRIIGDDNSGTPQFRLTP